MNNTCQADRWRSSVGEVLIHNWENRVMKTAKTILWVVLVCLALNVSTWAEEAPPPVPGEVGDHFADVGKVVYEVDVTGDAVDVFLGALDLPEYEGDDEPAADEAFDFFYSSTLYPGDRDDIDEDAAHAPLNASECFNKAVRGCTRGNIKRLHFTETRRRNGDVIYDCEIECFDGSAEHNN